MGEGTIPAFAKAVSGWFPEFGGRVVPVLDSKITKDNVPTLPFAMLALIIEKGKSNARTLNSPNINEDFLLEFWLEPKKYKVNGTTETEFWSFYDYEPIRNKLLDGISEWLSPRGSRVSYVSLETDSTEYASILTFRFNHEFEWCSELPEDDGLPFTITSCVQAPVALECKPECEECQPEESCP